MKRIFNPLSKQTGTITLCGTLIIALLLSLLTLSSPAPKNRENHFSAERAFRHIEAIAPKQHSVFDTVEIENVRRYIQETIDLFEHVQWERVAHTPITVTNQKTRKKELVEVHNVYAEIPGTSGTSLLLMAHYDSSPYKEKYGVGTDGSYGAADDGYGVATMLEIMRLLNDYASTRTMVNGIKFAFTDAEEVALGGAVALVKEYPHWLSDVSIFLNLEARGNKGPLYMFQTGDYNYKLISFFSRTRLPFSFSLAADVYKHLPNDTDFTPLLKSGYRGLNFATLNNLKYYHAPEDNLDNAHKPTLQFYGEQIYPLIQDFISNPRYSAHDYFDSKSDAVFFTLLPGFLIYYAQPVSWGLIALATISALLIAFRAFRKRAGSGETRPVKTSSETDSVKTSSQTNSVKMSSQAHPVKMSSETNSVKTSSETDSVKTSSETNSVKTSSKTNSVKTSSQAHPVKMSSETRPVKLFYGKKSLVVLGVWILFILCTALAGLFLAKGIGHLTHNRFSLLFMPYVPFDFGFVLIFATLVVVAGFFVLKLLRKLKCSPSDIFAGTILLFLLLTLLSAFSLHGATYLFLWPAIFMMAILNHNLFCPLTTKRQIIWKHLLHALALLTTSILYIILIYSLFLALTFGALAVILMFTAIYTCTLVPCCWSLQKCVHLHRNALL